MLWVFIIVFVLLRLILSAPNTKVKALEPCTLHKWEYKKQPGDENTEYLQCSICGFLPGHDDGTML